MAIRLLLLLFTIITLVHSASGQLQGDSLLKDFDFHRSHALQEKVYVHINRTALLVGEKLWFSVFVTNGTTHKPLTLSKVAYVEILDRENKSVLDAKIALNNGTGSGSFFIPASLDSDHYTLRAYTRWMKNFEPRFFFHQPITIINTVRPKSYMEPVTREPKLTATLYPEGGVLVEGIETTVAFHLQDEYGVSIDGQLKVLNANGEVILIDSTVGEGFGKFILKPSKERQLAVVASDKRALKHTVPMPSVQASGCLMSAKIDREQLIISIRSSDDSLGGNTSGFLLIHTRNSISTFQQVDLKEKEKMIRLDLHAIPPGISHITLFDSSFAPMCERLVYTPDNEKATISIRSNKQIFSNRENVNLTLKLPDGLKGNVSISVYKDDSIASFSRKRAAEYFLLGSDIGPEQNDLSKFTRNDSTSKAKADLMMLTKQWSRFNWNDLRKDTMVFEYEPEILGHKIEGTLTSASGRPASEGVLTFLSSPDKTTNLHVSRSRPDGSFTFDVKNLSGSRMLLLQTDSSIDSTFAIQIKNPFSEQAASFILPPLSIPAEIHEHLLKRSIAMQLHDSYLEGNVDENRNSNQDTIPFFGKADERYMLDSYTRFPVMEEVLREYVRGVLVRQRNDGFHLLVSDTRHSRILEGRPLLLIDGVPFFDVDKIMKIDPRIIQKLEVVSQRYILGPLVADGIISFSTYNNNLDRIELDANVLTLNYEGLQNQSVFHSPDYTNNAKQLSRVPDYRYQLFWDAGILLEGDQEEIIQFFTSDVEGRFIVEIEGITNDGKPISGRTHFEVRSGSE